MVSPGEPTGLHNCPPTQVGERQASRGAGICNHHKTVSVLLGTCSPDVTLLLNREQGVATYLVRPREGRISTMKIKNMYTLVIMTQFSPDLREVRGERPQGTHGAPGGPSRPCARCPRAWASECRHSLGPVRLQQRRVVDDGWEQG